MMNATAPLRPVGRMKRAACDEGGTRTENDPCLGNDRYGTVLKNDTRTLAGPLWLLMTTSACVNPSGSAWSQTTPVSWVSAPQPGPWTLSNEAASTWWVP